MSKDPIPLTDAINRLKDASKSDLYVELEEFQPGKYKIPFTFIPMLVGSQSQGKLYEHALRGLTQPEEILNETVTPATSADAVVPVPAGETWDVIGVISEFKAIGVAARTCQMLVTKVAHLAPFTSIEHKTSTFNLTDGQDAMLVFTSASYHFQNLNGTVTIVADENPFREVLVENENVSSVIATNRQVGDRVSTTVFYKKVG